MESIHRLNPEDHQTVDLPQIICLLPLTSCCWKTQSCPRKKFWYPSPSRCGCFAYRFSSVERMKMEIYLLVQPCPLPRQPEWLFYLCHCLSHLQLTLISPMTWLNWRKSSSRNILDCCRSVQRYIHSALDFIDEEVPKQKVFFQQNASDYWIYHVANNPYKNELLIVRTNRPGKHGKPSSDHTC